MTFFSLGVNYKIIPYKKREALYRLRRVIEEYWKRKAPGSVSTLATCNRIEIHGIAHSEKWINSIIGDFLDKYPQFKEAHIAYGRKEIFKRGLRLACGLESQLKGEYQILWQIEKWTKEEDFPGLLLALWENIIEVSKKIRKYAGLDKNRINIAILLFDEFEKHILLKRKKRVMVIGTGKIAELIACSSPKNVHLLFAARKNYARAKKLAQLAEGEALLFDEIPDKLIEVDAVISATSSVHYVLKPNHFKEALKKRKSLLYIYDIAVPSDVAPDVSLIPFIRVVTLDDLVEKFNQKDNSIFKQIEFAAELIEKEMLNYRELFNEKIYTHRNAPQYTCQQTG